MGELSDMAGEEAFTTHFYRHMSQVGALKISVSEVRNHLEQQLPYIIVYWFLQDGLFKTEGTLRGRVLMLSLWI